MWLWFWIVVAIMCAIGEVLTTDLLLASVSAGAVVAVILSLVLLPAGIQIAAFAGVSLAGIGVARPALKRALGVRGAQEFHGRIEQRHIEGKRAVVTEPVSAEAGQIRIGQGDYWSARSFDAENSYERGTLVEVMLVDGVIALVAPVETLSVLSQSGTTG